MTDVQTLLRTTLADAGVIAKLSNRTINALTRDYYPQAFGNPLAQMSLGQLAALGWESILYTPQLGKKGLREIEEALATHDVKMSRRHETDNGVVIGSIEVHQQEIQCKVGIWERAGEMEFLCE